MTIVSIDEIIFTNLGLLVLDPVSLVDDQVAPVELLEDGLLPDDHLVGGDADVPLPRQQHVTDQGRLGTDNGKDGTKSSKIAYEVTTPKQMKVLGDSLRI